MKKVLVVDDEVWVRKGIIKNINWDGMKLELAGEACDGDEAFEKVKELLPDIVITDMRMPGMDGRELIKNIKDYTPDALIIIISGYTDFEYTHEAIVNKVFDYIIKPIKKSEIDEVLNKALAYIEERKLLPTCYSDQEEMKQDILGRMLNIKYTDFQNISKEKLKQIEGASNASSFLVGICRLSDNSLDSDIKRTVYNDIKHLITSKLNNNNIKSDVFFNSNKSCELVFVVYDLEYDITDRESLFKRLIDEIAKSYMVSTNFEFGDLVYNIEEICISYEHAVKAGKMRRINEAGAITVYDANYREFESIFPPEKVNSIIQFLKMGDEKNIEKILIQLKNICISSSPAIYSLQKSSILFVGLIEKVLNEMEKDFEGIFYRSYMSYIDDILDCYEVDRLFFIFDEIFKKAVEAVLDYKKKDGELIVKEIVQHLSENYFSNISLGDYAQLYYLNPDYLSRLFKAKTGSNYIDYLTGIRIEKAKKLLVETEAKNYDISNMVGYENCKYFSQIFKKYTGLTPTEYRIKCSSNDKGNR